MNSRLAKQVDLKYISISIQNNKIPKYNSIFATNTHLFQQQIHIYSRQAMRVDLARSSRTLDQSYNRCLHKSSSWVLPLPSHTHPEIRTNTNTRKSHKYTRIHTHTRMDIVFFSTSINLLDTIPSKCTCIKD